MTSLSVRGIRGGVGNSSLLAALGHALHCLGERVLLVDMCPENLLGLHFNLAVDEQSGWARALIDGQDWLDQAWTLLPGLCLMPYGRLECAEQQRVEQQLNHERGRWAKRQLVLHEHFDWVLFDLPQCLPGHAHVGTCTLQIQVTVADAACDVMLQRTDTSCYLLVNQFDPASRLQRDLWLIWRKLFGSRMVPLAVHSDEAMREALAFKKPVGEYSRGSLAAQDVLSLAVWCLAQRRERS